MHVSPVHLQTVSPVVVHQFHPFCTIMRASDSLTTVVRVGLQWVGSLVGSKNMHRATVYSTCKLCICIM